MDPTHLRRALVAPAVAASLVLAGCDRQERASTDATSSVTERATVSWVVDGDTLRLADGRVVRLVQIDAPEARGDCYGRRATRALIELTPGGTRVGLERDPRLDDRDPYDRLLRYVLVGDENVNLALVARGAAAPYFFRNGRGRYADRLLDAARRARRDGTGFWGVCPRARLEPGLGSVTGPASSERASR